MAADVTVAPTLGHPILLTQGGVGASPGYDAIDLRRMIQAANGGQEGIYDATGWEVREHTSGANMQVQVDANVGIARVNGESVAHQGPYIVSPHSAVITLDVATAHSTNPRIDMVILHVRDNTHDALGANDARVRILSGTATSGATLDNLNGQASLPSNAIRLADVLVPAADTTISNAQIRDRRPWARGASVLVYRTSGDTTAYSATTWGDIDATSLKPRLELSGAPVVVRLAGTGTGSGTHVFAYAIDGDLTGTTISPRNLFQAAASTGVVVQLSWTIAAPSSGSHIISPIERALSGNWSFHAGGSNGGQIELSVQEIVRQNAQN